MEATLVPRPTWPFGRSEEAYDPFEAGPQPPGDPATAAAFGFPTRRPARPSEPTSPGAAPPARPPGLLEPPAPPATAGRAQPGSPWSPDGGAGRPRLRPDRPPEASSGASAEPPQPLGAAPSVPPPAARPATEARIIGMPEFASLLARISAADARDAARIEAAPGVLAPRVQDEARSDRGGPDRLSPPPVVMPPAAPAEPRVVIGRLLVEVTPPAAPPVRTVPPPPPPAPPRPFRAGAPSSALFRRPRGLGQG